jgi:hypothetical protein
VKLRSLKLFEVIGNHVRIRQKTVKHTPIEKLTDAFITILSGAHGLVEINTRLRPDVALQRAFGRRDCAEQSVVQQTLDACTQENVEQMQRALDVIFRSQSRAYRHDYEAELQLLDLDLTGLTCGPKAERATKGYFHYEGRYGRQMGRVVAAREGEVVIDRLYPGNLQLRTTLDDLVEAMERTLGLDESKRRRTVLRIDAGGGSVDAVNWLLARGYQIHCIDYSSRRAANFAQYVREWFDDPRQPDRQVGWIPVPSVGYARPVRRLMFRHRQSNGQLKHRTLLTTLEPDQVWALLGRPQLERPDAAAILVAYAELYDQRGGTVEIEFKEDKQGLGIERRNKKRFAAQQMVMLLGTLAHNVMVWAKRWLVAEAPRLNKYGVLRLVRDLFQISGTVELDRQDRVVAINLNRAAMLARHCLRALKGLLKIRRVSVAIALA